MRMRTKDSYDVSGRKRIKLRIKEEVGRKVEGSNPGAGKVFYLEISFKYINYTIVLHVREIFNDCTHSYVRDVT